MENNTQIEPVTPVAKNLRFALILIIFILVAGGGVYHWQHSKVTKLNSQVNGLNKQVASLNQHSAKSVQATNNTNIQPSLSSDEQVIAAVKNYCNATVDPETKQPSVLKLGTAGQSQKQVLYSSDKTFAYVNAVCSKDGATDGSGSAYYLKKVNSTWIFLYRGQMTSPEDTELFNIPSEFN
jgi:outer membrane murein-binding lipoprotein Lpp